VASARLIANEGKFDDALKQIDVVLAYDADNLDVRLLRGQIRIGQKDWAAGRAELADYLRQRPGDTEARKLAELCDRGKPDDPATLLAVVEALQRQQAFGPAAPLLEDLQKVVKEKQKLLPLYREKIDAAWQGSKLGNKLTLTTVGEFHLSFADARQVTTLAPLQGIPLNRLYPHRLCPHPGPDTLDRDASHALATEWVRPDSGTVRARRNAPDRTRTGLPRQSRGLDPVAKNAAHQAGSEWLRPRAEPGATPGTEAHPR